MAASRYRTDNGKPVIDVKLASIEHLFDNRDPAPFRERDLDPDLAEYLIDAGRDVVGAGPVRIFFWLTERCSVGEVESAVHSHFEFEVQRLERRRREQIRVGAIGLGVAAFAVILLTLLGEVVSASITGALGEGLREALMISGWVLMWRPMEVLIFEAIPTRRERRVLSGLAESHITVEFGLQPDNIPAVRHVERKAGPR